ncbi:MerR family transcriptional regulator [Mesorhizobium sp. M0909]|uniref:MerR family transcriptional regulator n=1 Tax=Mesorhizobium sp. M0909 TaxID=2957024 RepID=UPI0033374C63
MPIPKSALNGFTARQVHGITGLSEPMIEYLRRMDYLQPSHSPGKPRRGLVRFYSYRDLVVARLIQRLRETGIELSRLKRALEFLRSDEPWDGGSQDDIAGRLKWLVSDGKTVWLKSQDGFLDYLAPKGQRAFAFVVSINGIGSEVKERLSADQLQHFTMRNEALIYREAPTAIALERPRRKKHPAK